MKEKALRRMADKLNTAGVTWAIGASWLLCHERLLETYHDFDIMVAEKDTEAADKILTRLGMKTLHEGSGFRCSYHFDGADIDVSAGMVLTYDGQDYHVRFDEASVAGMAEVLGAKVPLMYPEDWYVLYTLMGRDSRAMVLAAHFAENGVTHPERFTQVVAEPLPASVVESIKEWRNTAI